MASTAPPAIRKRYAAPAPPERRCFTVDEYYRMHRHRILTRDERTELIEGEIIRMAAIGSHHFQCVNTFNGWLTPGLGNRAIVSVQHSVRLSDRSEPEPDLAILRPREDDYSESLPGPADVFLLIEVSESSFPFDTRRKLPLYAASGIPELWIAQLARQRVHAHRDPQRATYREVQIVGRDGFLSPQAFPDLRFPVAQLFKWSR